MFLAPRKPQGGVGGVACVVQHAGLGVSCVSEEALLRQQLTMDYMPFYCIKCLAGCPDWVLKKPPAE